MYLMFIYHTYHEYSCFLDPSILFYVYIYMQYLLCLAYIFQVKNLLTYA